jgi:NAD(P)-dependent dehydrogenase (short-subunit alcohol dehydrogenase family)
LLSHRSAEPSRLGKAGEVAKLLPFLCPNAASYISGSEVPIDGGQRV